jgi:hypothetical protein
MPYLSTSGLIIVAAFVAVLTSIIPPAVAIGLSVVCIAAIVGALILEGPSVETFQA